MGSYVQWKSRKSEDIPRVIWLCGDDSVLVSDVLEDIRSNLSGSMQVNLNAKELSESEIWHRVNQMSLDIYEGSLFVIRHAEILNDTSSVMSWINSKFNLSSNLVLVSTESDFPRAAKFGEQKVGNLKSHIKEIQKKGYLVRCSGSGVSDFKSWYNSSNRELPRSVAVRLVETCTTSRELLDTYYKLSALEVEQVKASTVDMLVSSSSSKSFVESLIHRDKAASVASSRSIARDDYKRIFGELNYKLGLCYSINIVIRNNLSVAEMSTKAGYPEFLIREYQSAAKFYDKNTFLKLKSILAALEDYAVHPMCDGLLESVIALW